MNANRTDCFLAALAVFLGLVVSGCRSNAKNPGYTLQETKAQAMFISHSIQELAFQNPDLFEEIVSHQPRSVFDHGLYAAATNSLAHAIGYRGEDYRVFPSGRDLWGSPYLVNISPAETRDTNSGEKSKLFMFSVRSIGPNQQDEAGKGDDISFGLFEAVCR